jgi:2-polyprenyl-6-methoxyphenol hydroxylase-like FAD-dependent oxidoreductase
MAELSLLEKDERFSMTTNDHASMQEGAVQALVIGAGIAGLLSARVLSEYYENVLIIERDVLPAKPEPRAGTPQSYHLHRLLPRGKMILERLFPGYVDSLLAQGAYPLQNKELVVAYIAGSATLRQPEKDVLCSRAMLEWELRQRVQALPNVRFLTGYEVIDLETSTDQGRITGVHLRERGHLEQRTTIKAELVVDASGRSSKLTHWLRELGYTLLEPEVVHSSIGYSSRYYQAPPHFGEKQGTVVSEGSSDKEIYAAAIAPIENNILTVILGSVGDMPYPPTDTAQFDHEVTRLISTQLIDMVQGAEPLAAPRGYRVPECVRQHYEEMEHWPAGLLVLGDALCHFDPIYGQGMTVAAIEAETLALCLGEQQQQPQPDFERRTLQRMQAIISPAWWLSAIADLRWPGTSYVGEGQPKGIKLIHAYIDQYIKYALKHQEVLKPGDKPDLHSPRPTLLKYLVMNGLVIPPQVVFNEATFALLLEAELATEGPHLLQEQTRTYHLPLKEILAEVVPSFAQAFERPKTVAAD